MRGAGEHSVHQGGQPQPKLAFARPFCGELWAAGDNRDSSFQK